MRRRALVAGMLLLVFIYAAFAQDVLPTDRTKAELQYIKEKKERDTLSLNDPIYLQLEKTRADAATRSGGGTDQGADYCPAIYIQVPYTDSGSTVNMSNDFFDCGDGSPDVIYNFYCYASGTYEINLMGSNYDTKLEVRSGGTCPGSYQLGCNDDYYGLQSALVLDLAANTDYYVIVEGYGYYSGDYVLNIFQPYAGRCCLGTHGYQYCMLTDERYCYEVLNGYEWTEGLTCDSACPVIPGLCNEIIEDSLVQNPDGSWTFIQTTDENSRPPLYDGWIYIPYGCDVYTGFGRECWFDGDFGWAHYWPGWNQGYTVQSVQVLICAGDVDLYGCLLAGDPTAYEIDSVFADSIPTNPAYLYGGDEINALTVLDIPPSSLLDDGFINMWVNFDCLHNYCWLRTVMNWSQLVVTYRTQGGNNPPFQPTGETMTCIGADSTIRINITGPTPADPDADNVSYTYRWFVANSLTCWAFVDDENSPTRPVNHTGNCVPPTDFDVGDIWRVQVYAVDEHGTQSWYPLIVDFPQVVQSCSNCENIDCENIIVINSIPWTSSFDLCQFCNHYDLSPCTGGVSDAPDMVFEMVVPENNSDLSVIATPLGNWDIALVLSYSCSESYWSCICGQVYRGGPENREGAGEPEQCNLINLPPDDVIFIFVSGNGTDCGPFSLFIGSPQPPEIQNLTIERVNLDACLSWSLPGIITPDGFIIYRNTDPHFIPSSADSIGSTTNNFWTDPGVLEASDHYFYRVCSYRGTTQMTR